MNMPDTYRKTAITVGVMYLLGFVVGIGGNILVQSILAAPDPSCPLLPPTACCLLAARCSGCWPPLATPLTGF